LPATDTPYEVQSGAPARVASLDLIRGVAVLGILAINIAGFAGPSIGALTPNLPQPAPATDQWAYAFGFLVFEGKMRALFAMLFGASMALFLDQAEARGRDGDLLQAKRLAWLALFGALHYFLIWWGDILFAYAACGLILLLLHRLPTRLLVAGSALLLVALSLEGLLLALPMVLAEEAVRLDHATAEQARLYGQYRGLVTQVLAGELRQYAGSPVHILTVKLREHPFWLLDGVRDGFGEFLPLMAFGLALQRSGFFASRWRRRTMVLLASGGIGLGLAGTLAALAWLIPRGFPVATMDMALRDGLVLPHLAMALGYAALLVLATPKLATIWLGQRLAAAGRMAFSNYIATSLLMTAIFYGWGLGLFGRIGPAAQWGFVLFGWAAMLAWSAPWLARHRRGPLEWLWRSLTQGKRLVNRR